MKKNSEYFRFIFIAFCAFIIACLFKAIPSKVLTIPNRISSSINDLSYWWVYNLSKKTIKPLKIVGIAIDDYSLSNIPVRWPWKRSIYAQLIRLLDNEHVNVIGFDLAFVGESEDKEQDRIFKEALSSAYSKIVLAYLFDYDKLDAILPLPQFVETSYSIGMLNTPKDADGKVRRLRSYIEFKDKVYYSFSVVLSAAFLNQKPKDLISRLPLLKDKTFLINYLIKPGDIIRLSFYDVVNNLEKLKKIYGDNFLKDAFVLIYPESEITHDKHLTPLGQIPGGYLHLNGVATILSSRFIRKIDILTLPLVILSLAMIFYLLRYKGFMIGALLTIGILLFNFWLSVLFNLKGIKIDYALVVISSVLFFILGSLYRYIYYLTMLSKIKDKVTLDPLRGIFTLRYFYYRLDLALRQIYFGKDLFLIFIYLESFEKETEGISFGEIKNIWQAIRSIIFLKESFWSVYSPEELVGCIVSTPKKIESMIYFLKNNLGILLKEKNIKSRIKICYLKIKKEYSIRELLFMLSTDLRKKKEETDDIVYLKDNKLANLFLGVYPKIKEKFLESLDEDIEERNRQLISLIEDLNREHARTKEAFFEIIISLVNALEARDPYTEGHSQRTCAYALKMAEKLNWSFEEKEKLRKAALLHDLGKIGIPDRILHKDGPLTEEEFDFIKKHEIIGIKIIEPLKEFAEIIPWILYHHEKWDGTGYPHGLAGNAIPLASQIISLADVYDALSTGRDYKRGLSVDEALNIIIKGKGTQFNPQLVDIFVEVIRQLQAQQ